MGTGTERMDHQLKIMTATVQTRRGVDTEKLLASFISRRFSVTADIISRSEFTTPSVDSMVRSSGAECSRGSGAGISSTSPGDMVAAENVAVVGEVGEEEEAGAGSTIGSARSLFLSSLVYI
jgi:hypothetical protein